MQCRDDNATVSAHLYLLLRGREKFNSKYLCYSPIETGRLPARLLSAAIRLHFPLKVFDLRRKLFRRMAFHPLI